MILEGTECWEMAWKLEGEVLRPYPLFGFGSRDAFRDRPVLWNAPFLEF